MHDNPSMVETLRHAMAYVNHACDRLEVLASDQALDANQRARATDAGNDLVRASLAIEQVADRLSTVARVGRRFLRSQRG